MMYASTKDFFKSHLDGLSLEFQASDLDEVSEQASVGSFAGSACSVQLAACSLNLFSPRAAWRLRRVFRRPIAVACC